MILIVAATVFGAAYLIDARRADKRRRELVGQRLERLTVAADVV